MTRPTSTRASLCQTFQLALLASVGFSNLSTAKKCNSDPALDAFNKTVNGRVHNNYPYALPCFSTYEGKPYQRDEKACAEVQANWASLKTQADLPNGYMNGQSTMCSSDPDDQCVLDSADPSNPEAFTNKNCRQGNVPTHYLEIQSPEDVQAAFTYANSSGRPIVIKNSGHDYLTHSSQKGALSLWTRNLQKKEYIPRFQAEGAPTSSATVRAITVGAGVNCGEVYRFAHQNNVMAACAYAETVGMSGGWVQNGGHSVLSPALGLGIDRVLQYKIVTPDGQYLTASAFKNMDVYWALRGGGGGTFGVVIESTHKVEAAAPVIAADIGFKPKNADEFAEFMEVMIREAPAIGDLGWGGHIIDAGIVYVNPLISLEQAQQSMRKISDLALSKGGHAVVKELDTFNNWYEEFIVTNTAKAGKSSVAASRLIPRTTFESEQGRKDLLDICRDSFAASGHFYAPIDVPVVKKPIGTNITSATQAWYSSLWHVTLGDYWSWNSSLAERKAVVDRANMYTERFESFTPGSGAYMNEADPFTKDWQEAWWGQENYQSLLAIKNRYDPHRLLKCWRCVGWEEADVKDSCYKAFV